MTGNTEELAEKKEIKKRKKIAERPLKPSHKPKGLAIDKLAKKKFKDISGLDDEFKDCFGDIDEAFDIIFFGDSSHGKTNAVAQFIEKLVAVFNCRVNYISYEEGAGGGVGSQAGWSFCIGSNVVLWLTGWLSSCQWWCWLTGWLELLYWQQCCWLTGWLELWQQQKTGKSLNCLILFVKPSGKVAVFLQ